MRPKSRSQDSSWAHDNWGRCRRRRGRSGWPATSAENNFVVVVSPPSTPPPPTPTVQQQQVKVDQRDADEQHPPPPAPVPNPLVHPNGAQTDAEMCQETTRELESPEGLPVDAELLDTHAGALGKISVHSRQMVLLVGTSLHTTTGVRGPFFGAVDADRWLNESGKTAFGSALLFALRLHPFYTQIKDWIGDDAKLMDHLEQCAVIRAGSVEACSTAFGAQLHIVPDFLGNHSSDEDPLASATVSGLRVNDPVWGQSEAGMAEWMVTVMCALCYGAKQITDQVERESGTAVEELMVSGSMVRSTLLLRLMADILQKRVFAPQCSEPVLLGAVLASRTTSDEVGPIDATLRKMVEDQRQEEGHLVEPQRHAEVVAFHQRKFRAYMALKRCEKMIREVDHNHKTE